MKRIVALTCLGVLAAVLQVRAQVPPDGAPPKLPPGPLVQTRAPAAAEWIVTQRVGSLGDTSAKPDTGQALQPGCTRYTITKTGDTYHVVQFDGQKTWNIWSSAGHEFLLWPDNGPVMPLAQSPNPDSPNPFYMDFTASDFPGFDWVRVDNYTGLVTFADKKCIVFKQSVQGDDTIAYVDLDTRLPVAMQSLGREYLYEWRPAPAGKLSLPNVVTAALASTEGKGRH